MTDFTETPYAEDFQWDLNKLLDEYMRMGMTKETAVMTMKMAIDDLVLEDEDE